MPVTTKKMRNKARGTGYGEPVRGGEMKTRITIIAENSKPFDQKHKDILEAAAKAAWQYLLDRWCIDPDDKVVVEKVEIWE